MKKKPVMCIVGSSIRNRADQDLIVEHVKKINGEAFLYEYIEELGREKKISNSEGCAIATAYGALQQGIDVRYLRLNDYFLKDGKTKNIEQLSDVLEESDGMIFALPVYFGDRSSLFDELIEYWKLEKKDFTGTVFGFISVGAKRNGGQETTNIFGMQSLTELNGLVVGNGPPTCQYGGTAVGGNIGTMENDYFGIMTSQGTGKKVAETIKIIKLGKSNEPGDKIKISFLILQEIDSLLSSHIESIIKDSNFKNVDFNVINLADCNLNRCYACNVCPHKDSKEEYKCINYNDDMKELHNKIIDNDGIILAGIHLSDNRNRRSTYQKFIERTRYIRRDDFKLTNILTTALSLNELGTHNLFNLRVLTSFIRHNTIIHKGMHNYTHNNEIIDCESKKILENFIEYARCIKAGRGSIDFKPAKYSPVGY
jgi:multimeric flavodoxin WrbA